MASCFQTRDVRGGTTTGGGAAPPRLHASMARVTVTGLVTGVIMMVTGAAGGIWCAGQTTARNLDTFTMRRMTAVRGQV